MDVGELVWCWLVGLCPEGLGQREKADVKTWKLGDYIPAGKGRGESPSEGKGLSN